MSAPKPRGLKHLRNRLGKEQVEVARDLGLNPKTYNHYEKRRRRPRDLGELLRLARYFGVSVEEIIWHLGGDEHQEDVRTPVRATNTA